MTDPEDRRPGAEPAPSEPSSPDPSPVDFVSPAGAAEDKPDVVREPVVVADPTGSADDDDELDDLGDDLGDDLLDEDEYDDAPFVPRRWVSLVTTLGLALVTVVGAQVLASIVEGFSLREGEPGNIPNDLLHRLGYPFGALGTTALLFLVVAITLMTLPVILDEDTSETQDMWVNVALVAATVLAVIIALGSGLRVRYELHGYAEAGQSVPRFFRIQLVSFLLGTLGAAATAVWGSLTAMRLRDRWD